MKGGELAEDKERVEAMQTAGEIEGKYEGLQCQQFLELNPRFLSGGASQGGFDVHCGEHRGGVLGQ